MMVMGVGFLLLRGVTSLDLTSVRLILPMGVIGIGLGVTMAQMVNLTLSLVRPHQVHEASGVSNTFRELGNALGTAAIGSLLLSSFYGGIVDGLLRAEDLQVGPAERVALIVELEDLSRTMAAEKAGPVFSRLPAQAQRALEDIVHDSLVSAQKDTLLVIGAFITLSLLLSTFLPRRGTVLSEED
jgi:hypothetical protein